MNGSRVLFVIQTHYITFVIMNFNNFLLLIFVHNL